LSAFPISFAGHFRGIVGVETRWMSKAESQEKQEGIGVEILGVDRRAITFDETLRKWRPGKSQNWLFFVV